MRMIALLAAGLFAGSLKADDKIDPAKLVGEWKAKETRQFALGIEFLPVFEYEKGGGVKLKLAQSDYVGGGLTHSAGTYKVTDSTLEQTLAGVDEKGKPREGLKPNKESREIVKLTDTELHLKEGKEVTVWLRLTADDKDTTVDITKLVGRWKSTQTAEGPDGEKKAVAIYEFTKDGKVVYTIAPADDLSKAKKGGEGTYKLKDKTLELIDKPEGDTGRVFDFVRLTDTKLVFRIAMEGPERLIVIGFERIKDEKKEEKKDK